ncbi:MAG: PadR family transcriptional regulator [Candidatus Aminicenantes bacterium]
MKILTRSDEILMLAILRLKDNAYGVSIIKEVEIRTGKKLTFGSLWVSMDILHKRGYIKKRLADPTPQRGGRSKIYYSLTPKGIKVLEKTREFQKSLWEGVPAQIKT